MAEEYRSMPNYKPVPIYDRVTWDINSEALHMLLIAPSGAGKTTTIKILTGQLRPTSGEAEVLGIPCDRIDETIYEQIGIVTDVSGVYERMSVFDNLKYFARILTCLSKRSTLS